MKVRRPYAMWCAATCELTHLGLWEAWHIPIALGLQAAGADLEQTAGTVDGHELFANTAWTPDLVAVHAVQQVFYGIQAVIGPWGSRIEGMAVIVGSVRGRGRRCVVRSASLSGRVVTRALYIAVGGEGSHWSPQVACYMAAEHHEMPALHWMCRELRCGRVSAGHQAGRCLST